MIAISDGMGTGSSAKKSSTTVINMVEKLLTSGFNKEVSINLINSTIALNSKTDMYSTIDIIILDLVEGNVEFIKNGAAPSYIKHKKNTEIIKALSLPCGILPNVEVITFEKELKDGDIIVLCTDGIMESNTEYNNKEVWVRDVLEDIETDNVQKIADILIHEAIDNSFGVAKDDMTVYVIKIEEI
jgi:stage II sporulation protein E